jgi:hypothetical protein
MVALIFAEQLPEASEPTLAGYLERQRETIRQKIKGAEFFGEEEQKEGDFIARTMEMRGHEPDNPQFHVFWYIRDGHTMYCLATRGSNTETNKIRTEARKLLRGFDLIEHRHKAKSTPGTTPPP